MLAIHYSILIERNSIVETTASGQSLTHELAQDQGNMVFHHLIADVQQCGNPFVALAARDG